jgi:hypothetical protein
LTISMHWEGWQRVMRRVYFLTPSVVANSVATSGYFSFI